MLKLTNSFYRFFTVTCENFNYKTHVSPHIGIGRKCGVYYLAVEGRFHTSAHLRKNSHSKKRLSVKIPPLNDKELDKSGQMSELQPTQYHASYGGNFSTSADEDSAGEDCNDAKDANGSNIPPDFRVWENVHNWTSSSGGLKFKVLSYNVLAQYLLECHPYLYTECFPRNLKWKVRSSRLYNEIINLAPDILCLQEVQVSHLESFYSNFEKIGYRGIFKQKTGQRQDGCAIYYKQSLFEKQDQISVEYYQPELPILNRDNIGIIVKLGLRGKPGCSIVVATTHLLYNPKRTDVRLAQIRVFLAEIDRFAYYNNEKGCGHLPIIMTGDLNSVPQSDVIKLLNRGHIKASQYRGTSDWQRIGVTDNCQHLSVYLDRQDGRRTDIQNVKIHNSEYHESPPYAEDSGKFRFFFNSEEVGHSLNLASVYHHYKYDGSEEASTFQDAWATVDYIFFSCCSNLRLHERLRLPTASECEVLGKLPNSVYGSDHLALAAVFELVPPAVSSAL